jgi:hypothetical protein
MSIRIMSAAWEVHLPDSEKLILLALADWSNDEGECWPSVARIAQKSSKSERTVQGALAKLEAAGHISRDQRLGRGCLYTVHPRKDCTPAAAAPPQSLRPAAPAPTPAAAAPNTSLTPQASPETSSPPKRRARSAAPKVDEFPKPEGVDAGHWRDFLANRKRKRLPNTASAHAKLMRDIERFTDAEWPPGRILQHAAESGWAGIYDPRDKRNGQRTHHNGHSGGHDHDRTRAAAIEVLSRMG